MMTWDAVSAAAFDLFVLYQLLSGTVYFSGRRSSAVNVVERETEPGRYWNLITLYIFVVLAVSTMEIVSQLHARK